MILQIVASGCLSAAAVYNRSRVCPAFCRETGQALVGPPRGARAPMDRRSHPRDLPRIQLLAEQAFATVQRFLHVEAVSGLVLLIARP